MKCLILCLIGSVTMVYGATTERDRGCLYIGQGCKLQCPEGSYAYAPEGGCGSTTPEPTCDEPNPKEFMICDYTACHCVPPTVRDKATNKCVKLEDCPKKQ